ncbi:PREDICTED: hexamerin-like [Vollenhovia emeryi]|uniref:hexamerin-like n=1 Tax=Vollenhovia emeryi TaxID=411798 RepID=UPI0005F550B2|nr:PREDICTED: hexamerin-like [Vollenhovia emeryi]
MRCAIVLLALAAFGAALPQQQQQQLKQHAADQDLLKKQQDVILLLQHITQEIPNEQLQILGTTYDIQNNYQQYENPILVKYYAGAVQAGLVQPKGTAYSSSVSQLRKEVSLLHRVLLGAKTYQTFLATAAWARVHVNEGQFIKAFIGAVLQHPETQGLILPPWYEIIPQHYFDARVIQEAQNAIAQGVNWNQLVIPVNYSAQLSGSEQQLSYFTQDVGLSNYYGYVNLAGYLSEHGQQVPPPYQQQGVQNQEGHIGHGSIYYYLHQQLLAHYELNRLANGLGPIHHTDYVNVQAPYQPHLRHTNGLEFPGRPHHLQLSPYNHHLVHTVQKIEQRLIEAIDSGHVITPQGAFLSLYQPQGLNILGEIIEGTGRSVNPRYYGSLQAAARQLLGNAPEAENIYDYTPSVLELGQIAVQDPAFYQLYQKVIQLFQHYQNSLPAYQYNDIHLPGVSIQNVEISPLVTFFNNYYVDLDAASHHEAGQQQQGQQQQQQQQQQQHIKAQVKRLDHKPYEYQITVQSEQNVPGAVVRVYLGPKYDYHGKPISISHHRHQFVELDQFITDLQQGQNIITRQSQQAPTQSHDYPSVQDIKQGINNAVHAQEPYYITEPHQIFGFPARLALPKGHHGEGFPVQLFVVISQPGQQNVPYGPVVSEQYQTYQHGEYQVVGTEDYQQIQHQGSKVVGVKQTVEVVPENLPTGQQENQAVRNHYAHIYTQQHGHYPYTHSHYQVGQGQVYGEGQNVFGAQGQYYEQGQQGQHGQHGQYAQGHQQWGQWGQSQGIYQGQQGQQYQQQYQHGQQSTVGVQGGVPPTGVHGSQQGIHGAQGVQSGVQGVQGTQYSGVQGTQGVHSGIQSGIQGKYHTTYQGQSQQQQGYGVGYTGSGQYHAGGFQGILGQGHQGQDGYVSKYYQNKHISEIIGGAISLDGKPLGYPLDRPLTTGALSVPNVYVHTVHIHHEGQPTNEVYYQ